MYKNLCSAFYFLEQTKNRDSALTSAKTEQWVFCFPEILSEMELKATGACTHVCVKHTYFFFSYFSMLRRNLGQQLYVSWKGRLLPLLPLPPLLSALWSPFQGLAEQLSKCSSAKGGCRNRAFRRAVETSFHRWAKVLRDGCWLLTSKFN